MQCRSLSLSSSIHGVYNTEHDAPYWRGPIWFNINFLALRALHKYSQAGGPHAAEAMLLYSELRTNLLSNLVRSTCISCLCSFKGHDLQHVRFCVVMRENLYDCSAMHTQQYAPACSVLHHSRLVFQVCQLVTTFWCACVYSSLPVMKMSRAVADIVFVCRSGFTTKLVTFGRTMMRLMVMVKAVTHLAAGQLCLCLWQVRHIDMHPDMHNPWPYSHDADMHSPHGFIRTW